MHVISREDHSLTLSDGTKFTFDAIGKTIYIYVSREYVSACITLDAGDALLFAAYLVESRARNSNEYRFTTLDNLNVVVKPGEKSVLSVYNKGRMMIEVFLDKKASLMLAEMIIRSVRHTVR